MKINYTQLTGLTALVLFPILMMAQGVVRSDTISIPFQLKQENGQIFIEGNLKEMRNSSDYFPLIELKEAKLEEADALLSYKVVKLLPNFTYDIHLLVEPQDTFEDLIIPNFRELEGINGQLRWDAPPPYQTVWKDVLEGKLDYDETYTFKIQYDLLGNLNCDQAPKPNLSFRKNWYHYLVIAAGVGAIISGEAFGREAEDLINQYDNAWKAGESRIAAQPIFEDAQDHLQREADFKNIGISILAAEAIWVGYNYFRFRKRVKAYKSYCGKKVETGLSVEYLQGDPFVGLGTRIYLGN
ncbi:MAG: hypothetical protein AAF849_05625 [Bacteroidota bacterium]